jgi:hypothetical protein
MLEQIIAGHVGHTLFQAALCGVIADDVSRGMLQQATVVPKPTKPTFYKDILKCQDRQTRDTMISNLSDDDKSAVILYALWEKNKDNSELIATVAAQFDKPMLTGGLAAQLTKLKGADALDADNYAALITSGTTLGDGTRAIFGD